MLDSVPADDLANMSSDDPGRYPTGSAGQYRDWDGHAWATSAVTDAPAPALESTLTDRARTSRRRRRIGVALAAVGVLVGAAIAAGATAARPPVIHTGGLVLAALVAVGGVLTALSHCTMGRLRMGSALGRNGVSAARIAGLGLGCGLLGLGLALGIEESCQHLLGVKISLLLFLAGPIEETAKLALPVVLLLVWRGKASGAALSDPRVGLLLVWLSGSVFGLAEGIEYIVGIGPKAGSQHLAGPTAPLAVAVIMTCMRSVVEMMHPLLTGGAAAVIWLTRWRGLGLLNPSAIGAFLIAVGLHSFNDGVIAGVVGSKVPGVAQVGLVAIIVVAFLIFRLNARELMPPSRLLDNPPRWRPRVVTRRPDRSATPEATVGS